MGVALGSATGYGTVALSGVCFLVILFYMSKKDFNLQTIEEKEELKKYEKDIIYRKLLHALNSIVKQLEKTHGESSEIKNLYEAIKYLNCASQGDVIIEPDRDELAASVGLLTKFLAVVPKGEDE